MKRICAPSLALAFFLAAPSLFAATYYAAPRGTSSGDGSLQQPWDLTTALGKNNQLGPGDELLLLAGTYSNGQQGPFRSYASGSSSSPVVVKPAAGAEVVIDGGFEILLGDVVFRDLTVTSSNPVRSTSQTGSWPTGMGMQNAFSVLAPRVKIINNILHDVGLGVAAWVTAPDTTIYGNIIYHIGWSAPDRDHGTAFYIQNDSGVKLLKDNIAFNSFRHGFQLYGTDVTALRNIIAEGNIAFNNGALSLTDGFARNFLLGGGVPAVAPVFRSNYSYFPLEAGAGDNNIGYWPNGVGCTDLVFEDNYFVSGGRALVVHKCPAKTFRGNTVVGELIGFSPADYPDNSYYTAAKPPTGVKVAIRPNAYEVGRAHIVIYNWDRLDSVPVDLSKAGLRPGDSYELINVQNFEYGRLAGVYGGGTVKIAMTDRTVGQPNNWSTPGSTFPAFGVFLVRKSGGTPVVTPPPALDNQPPNVSVLNPVSGQQITGLADLRAAANDNESVSLVQFELNGAAIGPAFSAAPYEFRWDSKGLSDGDYSITATAIDPAGNKTRSVPVAVHINNSEVPKHSGPDTIKPVVEILSPKNNQIVSQSVEVVVDAVDDQTIAWVRIMVDGLTVARLTQAPYRTGVDISGLPDGPHSILALAEDLTTNRSQVKSVSVLVDNDAVSTSGSGPKIDTQAPTISISQPVNGAGVAGVVAIGAVAADNVAVAKVQFKLDGSPIGGPDAAAPFTIQWDSQTVPDGSHVLTATATDAAGNAGASAAVTIVVDNQPIPTPSGGGTTLLTIEAESGVLTNPMKRRTHPDASGNQVIRSPVPEIGTLTLPFRLKEAGDFVIWVRGQALNLTSNDLYYSIDGGPEGLWKASNGSDGSWQWSPLEAARSLGAGDHRIVFRGRGNNVMLDVVQITNIPGFIPE